MFKSILALIPSERPVRPVVDGSVVLAMACHAHVNALAIGYEFTNIPMAAITGPATAMIFQENRLRAIERGETAMSVFELEAKEAGISYNCRTISAIPAEAISIAGAVARLHELTIALQPEFELPHVRQRPFYGNLVPGRRPGTVHAIYIPWRICGTPRRSLLGREPSREPRVAGRNAAAPEGRCTHDHHHHEFQLDSGRGHARASCTAAGASWIARQDRVLPGRTF